MLKSWEGNGLSFLLAWLREQRAAVPCCVSRSASVAKLLDSLLKVVEVSPKRELGGWSQGEHAYPDGHAFQCHSSLQLAVLQCLSSALNRVLGLLLLLDVVSAGQDLCLQLPECPL